MSERIRQLGGPFGLHNLPYGVVASDDRRFVCVRVDERVLDLGAVERAGLLDARGAFQAPTLNPFLALGRPQWTAVRERLGSLLRDRGRAAPFLAPLSAVVPALPFEVADYVDFYASREHATNLGRLFRPEQPPLLPNWTHLPVGYHGRAGTVVVSGTEIARPHGQRGPGDFGPSQRLDIEAEVGFVVGVPSSLGRPLSTADFADHVFGVVLVNDWSARDLQAWEYQPLGPFLGKSFATSISPWVVPLDALAHARVPAPAQDPPPLPYLTERERYGYDIRLAVHLNGRLVSRPPFAGMYWTPAQMLAHLTANGASVRTGDLFASGTVSGAGRDECGSLIEMGPKFLADGDTVTITATAPGADATVVGLGEVTGRITGTRGSAG